MLTLKTLVINKFGHTVIIENGNDFLEFNKYPKFKEISETLDDGTYTFVYKKTLTSGIKINSVWKQMM